MKRIKLFEEFINEYNYHMFGPDSSYERRAAASSSGRSMPWKNSKALISRIKSNFLKPEDINKFSTSRVTIKPGSSQYITFNSKAGFDMDVVIDILNDKLKRFNSVNGTHALITDVTATSFSLMILKSYDNFTDDYGKEINLSTVPNGYYITK